MPLDSNLDVKELILARAVELWKDPKNRGVGKTVQQAEDGTFKYCAGGVLLQASNEVGVDYSVAPSFCQMATWIGFNNSAELIIKNDADWPPDWRNLLFHRGQQNRNEIYQRMKTALDEHRASKAQCPSS